MNTSVILDVQLKNQNCYTKSTVLIPDQYTDYYQNRCKQFGSRKAYFQHIINKYLPNVTLYRSEINNLKMLKWKTCYQSEGIHLRRRNFVPLPADWEALRHMSGAFGVSMCFLFVFLMQCEMKGMFHFQPEARVWWNSALIGQKSFYKPQNRSHLLRILDKKQNLLMRIHI